MTSADIRQLATVVIQAWSHKASVVYAAITSNRVHAQSWDAGHGPYHAQPVSWLCEHIDRENVRFVGLYPFGGDDGSYAGYWLMATRVGQHRQVNVWREASHGGLIHSHRLVPTIRISREAVAERELTEACALDFDMVPVPSEKLNALRRLADGYGGSNERLRQRLDAQAIQSVLQDGKLPAAALDALNGIMADATPFIGI